MKKLFLLSVLSLLILSCGQKGGENQENKENKEQEVGLNDKIQDTFFGVKFGASREEVIKAFEERGFKILDEVSSNVILNFDIGSEYFSFGGMHWNHVNVNLYDNKFYEIDFALMSEIKETALGNFESVLSLVSSKYKIKEKAIEDNKVYREYIDNMYKDYVGYSKDGRYLRILYFSIDNCGRETYHVHLIYGDETFNKPNDEL